MHCTHTCTLAYYYTVHVHYCVIVYAEATIPVKQRLHVTIFSSLLVAKNSPISSVPTQCNHVLLSGSARTQSMMLCVCECVCVCVCVNIIWCICVCMYVPTLAGFSLESGKFLCVVHCRWYKGLSSGSAM